jgi:hypothetical protein
VVLSSYLAPPPLSSPHIPIQKFLPSKAALVPPRTALILLLLFSSLSTSTLPHSASANRKTMAIGVERERKKINNWIFHPTHKHIFLWVQESGIFCVVVSAIFALFTRVPLS